MEKVIAVKVISDQYGWLDDANMILTRTLWVLYSDYTWKEYEVKYNALDNVCIRTYPKTFRPKNITDKKMTREEVQKYIDEFEKSEGL